VSTFMRPGTLRRVSATMLLVGIVFAAGSARAGAWVADAKSGCQVWNPNPQLEESVAWSGSCANGRAEGHGVARWSKDGNPTETDEGEWLDGRQAGKGTQTWSSGRYEGELSDGDFRNGKPNGVGTLTAGSETVRGTWKDGCLQGQRKGSIGVPLSACR
jgi:hypothetical protein